jgi:hypothetical protein
MISVQLVNALILLSNYHTSINISYTLINFYLLFIIVHIFIGAWGGVVVKALRY